MMVYFCNCLFVEFIESKTPIVASPVSLAYAHAMY